MTVRAIPTKGAVLAAVVLACVLPACGGDDGSESSSSLGDIGQSDSLGATGDSGDDAASTSAGDDTGSSSGRDSSGSTSGSDTGDSSDTGSSTDTGDSSETGDTDGGEVPTVQADPTYQVEVTELVYGTGQVHTDWGGPVDGTLELKLDVYEPVDAPGNRPAFFIVHGGGFSGGSKEQEALVNFADYFASRGFVSVSIDYRLVRDRGTVPQAWLDSVEMTTPPEQANQALAIYPAGRDAKAALRWLHANADTYQINTDYVTAMGGSAGAMLAIMLGVTEPEDYRDEITVTEDPTLATTNLGVDADVHTIIDHWGGTVMIDAVQVLTGANRFDANDAPISIVHGTADPTVPFTEAEELRAAYMGTGVPHAWYPLQDKGHGPWGASYQGKTLSELAWDFVIEQQELMVGG